MTDEIRYKCNNCPEAKDLTAQEMLDHLTACHLEKILNLIEDYWIEV